MGGAVTNLAAVKHAMVTYDRDVVQGTVLDRSEIDRQIDLYRTRSAEQRRGIVGLQPARAEVILACDGIVRTVLTLLGADALTVSDRALLASPSATHSPSITYERVGVRRHGPQHERVADDRDGRPCRIGRRTSGRSPAPRTPPRASRAGSRRTTAGPAGPR